ncbi:MAG TPA: hypothetical protein VFR04_08945 [Solirubrobacterales bacterium]|nr:hypothetical protein [Solirubrobacterales bacterium]
MEAARGSGDGTGRGDLRFQRELCGALAAVCGAAVAFCVSLHAPAWVSIVIAGLAVVFLGAIPLLLVAERGVHGRWIALAALGTAGVAGLIAGGVFAAQGERGELSPRYAKGLSRALRDLSQTQQAVLAGGLAGTRTEQAKQVSELAAAFTLAAARVGDLSTGPAGASSNRSIAAAMEAVARAYEKLRAATLDPDGSQERLDARLADVRAAMAHLREVERGLAAKGYALGRGERASE